MKRISKLDWILLLGLIVLYTLLALFRLGSLSAPVHHWKPAAQGESVVLDLGRETNVSRIYMYEGLGNGAYYYRYSNTPNGPWKDGVTFEVKEVFKWTSMNTNFKARYVMLVVKNKGAEIKEIALVEAGKTVPVSGITVHAYTQLGKWEGTPKNLLDEQNTFEYAVSFMTGTYFDEIYHARTAYEHINLIEPYENTHPPLGKVIIALGILIFGMNPFGWRIMGTIFGIIMIPVIYIFALQLFKKTEYAFLAAFLMTFDFMHFAQTRIATIDTYVVLFIMLMYYFMYRFHTASDIKEETKMLFASGLFFGLACASKWIGIYGGAGLAILFLFFFIKKIHHRSAQEGAQRFYVSKTLIGCLFYFMILPAVIYLLSYIPFMLVPGPGHGLKEVISYQAHMFSYHNTLTATHPFSSPWWSWPIILRPVWLYMGIDLPSGMISSIVTMGNPAIWWAGILAVFGTLYLVYKRNDQIMFTVLIAFLFQYMPWMFISRTLFIYHFFSSVPFIILCIVYCFKDRIEHNPSWRKWMFGYMGVVLLLFILFYPVLSGMVIPQIYRDIFLRWFGTWGF